jgi:hypothetical protein
LPPGFSKPVRTALLLAGGLLIPGLPLYHSYSRLQLEWADIGSIYDMLRNVFEVGYLRYYETGSDYLQIHFTLFLFPLAWLMRPLPHLPFLLALHVLALVGGAYALFLISLSVTRSEAVSILLFLMFLASPYAMAAVLYPHYNIFMVPALLFFYYFLLRGWAVAGTACLLLALSIKEDVWVYALCLLLTQVGSGKTRLIAWQAGITVAYFLLGTQWLWPHLLPDRQDVFLQCFAQGSSKMGVGLYLLGHPLVTAQKLWTGPGLGFFSTLLFLPFLAPLKALCVLPPTYLWLNSTSPERSSLAFNNGIPSLVLFVAILPYGLRTLEQGVAGIQGRLSIGPGLRDRLPRGVLILAGAVLLGASVLGNLNLPAGLEKSPNLHTVYLGAERRGDGARDHYQVGWDILEHRMRPNTSVITDFNLATYTRERHQTYGFHRDWPALKAGTLRPDYVLYHLKPLQPAIGPRRMRAIHEWMLDNRDYRLVYSRAEYYLFERAGESG